MGLVGFQIALSEYHINNGGERSRWASVSGLWSGEIQLVGVVTQRYSAGGVGGRGSGKWEVVSGIVI